jgi:hypothetical protein
MHDSLTFCRKLWGRKGRSELGASGEHYDTGKCWCASSRMHPDRTTRLSSVSLFLRSISQMYGTICILYGNGCIIDCSGGVDLDIDSV